MSTSGDENHTDDQHEEERHVKDEDEDQPNDEDEDQPNDNDEDQPNDEDNDEDQPNDKDDDEPNDEDQKEDEDDNDGTCTGDGMCLTLSTTHSTACRHECIPIECVNVEVCGRIAPAWQFRARGGLCAICFDMFGRLLHIERNSSKQECPVCYQVVERWVEFPADCGHFFCGACIARLLMFDETRFYLSPVPFGGPSCPNECNNPRQGVQCNCVAYDVEIQEWELTNRADWVRWTNAEWNAIEDAQEWSEDMRKCPLCRERP